MNMLVFLGTNYVSDLSITTKKIRYMPDLFLVDQNILFWNSFEEDLRLLYERFTRLNLARSALYLRSQGKRTKISKIKY